ncbi:hypothetical protein [Kribbella pratensis]|uniref:hypothetical protein n=1 Tax=Kribbella pratensis TaxID=2512112 RepID=UPI001065C9F5|nr:hypothetical protein [Kribbella pratensis]
MRRHRAAAEFGVERVEDLDGGADLAEFRRRRCIEKWLDVVLYFERFLRKVGTSTSTTSKYLTMSWPTLARVGFRPSSTWVRKGLELPRTLGVPRAACHAVLAVGSLALLRRPRCSRAATSTFMSWDMSRAVLDQPQVTTDVAVTCGDAL